MRSRIFKKGQVGAGRARLVGIEEVVDGGIVLVDRLGHQAEAQHTGVEGQVSGGIGGDAGNTDATPCRMETPHPHAPRLKPHAPSRFPLPFLKTDEALYPFLRSPCAIRCFGKVTGERYQGIGVQPVPSLIFLIVHTLGKSPEVW